MKRAYSIFAAVAVLGLAACGGAEEEPVVEEVTPAVDATAPVVEPVAPMTTDTMAMGGTTTDTMGMGGTTTDTMAGATTQP